MAIQVEHGAVADAIRRLEDGEKNPWLVYELAKAWRETSLIGFLTRLPQSVDMDVIESGWQEYESTRR